MLLFATVWNEIRGSEKKQQQQEKKNGNVSRFGPFMPTPCDAGAIVIGAVHESNTQYYCCLICTQASCAQAQAQAQFRNQNT